MAISKTMNIKTEVPATKKFDGAKWALAIILFVAGMVANYYYTGIPSALRVIGWIVLFLVIAGIAAQTQMGRLTLVFMREARMEMRKVVWPTRQETVQTTMIVMFLVVFVAIFLWIVDAGLLWCIAWLTGQRG